MIYKCTFLEGYVEAVELLLQNGSDVLSKDNAGDTPLHLASSFGNYWNTIKEKFCGETNNCISGHEKIVKMLLEKTASVDVENNDGQKPRDIAEEEGS